MAMAFNALIPEPDNTGCYSKHFNDLQESLLAQIVREKAAGIHVVDTNNAGELLFHIWNVAEKAFGFSAVIRPPQFSNLDQCNVYVGRHPDLVSLLAAVHEKKAYAWLCEHLVMQRKSPRPLRPIYSKNTVTARIANFTKIIAPKIRDFLTNQRLPIWLLPEPADETTQAFYRDLAIPSFKGKPSLLLHGLGEVPNLTAEKLFSGTVFSGSKFQILSNVTGSGKTRLLFEGLCRHWTFYFVVAQGPDGIGAPDLEAAIETMSKSSGWINDIFEDRSYEQVKRADANNERIATNSISEVLLARWVVLDAFIQVAKDLNGGVLHDGAQRDWLLFQVLPLVLVDGLDPFSACIRTCLADVSYEVLDSLSTSFYPSGMLGSAFNSRTESFFYVLDDAHVASTKYMGAFADVDGMVQQPVLHPIIRYISATDLIVVKAIVSGTGFSLDHFKTFRGAGVAKDSSMWDVVHITGEFSDSDTQSAYISRYLPPSFLLSESGAHFKTRIYDWLRGRHRFTARYLEELMRGPWQKDRPASPHKLLNAYVQGLAGFTPLDGDRAILEKEANVGPVESENFQWDMIKNDPKLLEELAQMIHAFVTRGEPLSGQEPLVEYGIARFVLTSSRPRVTVEEPLALASIIRYFESNSHTLDDNVRRRLQDNNGTTFEEAVHLAMARLLQNPRELSSILRIHV